MYKSKIIATIFAITLASANSDNIGTINAKEANTNIINSKIVQIFDSVYEQNRIKEYGKWVDISNIKVTPKVSNQSKTLKVTKTIKKNFKLLKDSIQIYKPLVISSKKIVSLLPLKRYKSQLPTVFKSYYEFKKYVDLRKSYKIYQDKELLSKANPKNIKLIIDVSNQRVKLLAGDKVALDAPCTTGSKHKLEPNTKTYRDKHTPLGTFKILEKIAQKRSTIFVNIYKNGRLIYHGDRRKYRGSLRGVKIVGAPLFNWMRLTSSGIGLHASSHIKRYPGSNGCIRLPKRVANTIFNKVKRGTIVKVVQ